VAWLFNPFTGKFDMIDPETAATILSKLLTVDGTGSNLDADFVDGQHATDFQTASPDLTLIAQLPNLAQTGLVKYNTSTDAWSLDTVSYEPADATIVKTGQANWIDLTDGGATTLHSHAGGSGDVIDSGVVVGQLTKGVTDSKHITAAAIIPPASNILTLTNAAASTLALAITAGKTLTLTSTDDFNLTIPATGTAALLGTANVFTAVQQVSGALACAPTTNAFGTASIYTSFIVGNLTGADAANGGLYGIARYDKTKVPFTGLCGWDTGAARQLHFGGGSWSVPDATAIFFYTAPTYNETINTGVQRVSINSVGTLTVHASGSNPGFLHTDGTRQLGTYLDTTGGWIGTVTNHSLLFFTNNSVQKATLTSAGFFGVGLSLAPLAMLHVQESTTTTNAVKEVQRLGVIGTASNVGAAGFGVAQTFFAETATNTTVQQMAQIAGIWVDATNATRKAKLQLSAFDTAQRIGLEIEASGTAPMIGFFGVQAVARATEMTDELTTITYTAPGTPDYAIQDLTDTGGFGFVTKDEGNTVLSVIANLQTRVNELETKLTAYGLLTDAD
jgi:hypothetical protein